jgi:hypothetical protein
MTQEERNALVEKVHELRTLLAMHYNVHLEDKGTYVILTVNSGDIAGLVRVYCPSGLKVNISAVEGETVLFCTIQ